ncbi:MAG: AMP-binding protein [Aeromicrobium erythreum]
MSAEPAASLHPVGGEPRAVLALLRDWWETATEPLVVRTSGSTGRPKDVLLSRRALEASARATHERLGGPGQWLLDLPVPGVAGLQVLVRSIVAGTDPVVVAEHPDLRSALTALQGPRTYASLVPTQLHRLDRDGRLGELAGLDALLVGGAATDPGLLDRARSAGVRVVRTYGMSETSGGCVYDGVPLDGVRIRLDDDGQVLVSGPVLFDGYGSPQPVDWFATGDLGELDDAGVLRITGRLDDVVKIGGAKVALPAVEQAVRAAPGVADAAVVAVPDAEWGSRVVAFVVPADAVCLDGVRREALRDALVEQGLDRRWAPREVVLVDAVPLLPGGKVDRLALRRTAATSVE